MDVIAVRWDPEQQDTLFLTQAASLAATHYLFQIAVHRPFMSSTQRNSPLSFPSLIICTNSARSCIQVLDVLYKRTGTPYFRSMVCLGSSFRGPHEALTSSWLRIGILVHVWNSFDDEHTGAETRWPARQHGERPTIGEEGDRDAAIAAHGVRVCSLRDARLLTSTH